MEFRILLKEIKQKVDPSGKLIKTFLFCFVFSSTFEYLLWKLRSSIASWSSMQHREPSWVLMKILDLTDLAIPTQPFNVTAMSGLNSYTLLIKSDGKMTKTKKKLNDWTLLREGGDLHSLHFQLPHWNQGCEQLLHFSHSGSNHRPFLSHFLYEPQHPLASENGLPDKPINRSMRGRRMMMSYFLRRNSLRRCSPFSLKWHSLSQLGTKRPVFALS